MSVYGEHRGSALWALRNMFKAHGYGRIWQAGGLCLPWTRSGGMGARHMKPIHLFAEHWKRLWASFHLAGAPHECLSQERRITLCIAGGGLRTRIGGEDIVRRLL